MTIGMFLSFNSEDQEEIIRQNGVFLGKKEESGKVYNLYQVDSFYIEFYYSGEGLVSMKVFNSPDLLTHYLDEIDISMLYVNQ